MNFNTFAQAITANLPEGATVRVNPLVGLVEVRTSSKIASLAVMKNKSGGVSILCPNSLSLALVSQVIAVGDMDATVSANGYKVTIAA